MCRLVNKRVQIHFEIEQNKKGCEAKCGRSHRENKQTKTARVRPKSSNSCPMLRIRVYLVFMIQPEDVETASPSATGIMVASDDVTGRFLKCFRTVRSGLHQAISDEHTRWRARGAIVRTVHWGSSLRSGSHWRHLFSQFFSPQCVLVL